MSAADLAWLAAQVYGGAATQWPAQAQVTAQASTAAATPKASSDASWAAQFAGFQQNKHLDAQGMAGAQADAAWQMGLMGGCGVVVPPPSGNKGKGKGGPAMPRTESDAIYIAVNTAMNTITADDLMTPTDGPWDAENLKRRLAKYFRSAAKGMSFDGEYEKVINDFADTALGNVTWALQGTKFLAKADFTLVLEVAVTELFPDSFKERIPESAPLQDAILRAHDRALEEARFLPFLQDTVKSVVEGKKAQNKVYNAAEAARREVVAKVLATQDDSADFFAASENGVMGKIQDFSRDWITGTFKQLGDWPESVLDSADAVKIFDQLLGDEATCLPRSLLQYMVEPLPQPWDFIATTINEIYRVSKDKYAAESAASGAKKRKARADEGPNWQYKTEWCRNITTTGTCKMGEWCVFAHNESELYGHKGSIKGMFGKGPPMDIGKGAYPKGGCDYGMMKGGCDDGMMKGGYDDGYGKGCKGGKDPFGKGPIVPQYGAHDFGPPKGKGGGGCKGKGGGGKYAKGPPRPTAAPHLKGGYDEAGDGDGEWGPEGEEQY